MRKTKAKVGADGMRSEYDFSGAVRGKYYERYKASSNVVVLDPDVCEVFPNADSVNKALRALSLGCKGSRPRCEANVQSEGRPNKALRLARSRWSVGAPL